MEEIDEAERIVEKRNHNGNAGAFLLGTLIGGLTAAITMFLYAPQSGAEAQDLIRKKTNELKVGAEETIQKGRHAAEDRIVMSLSGAAEKLEQLATNLNQQAEQIKDDSNA
jgi:gas vesicle protein